MREKPQGCFCLDGRGRWAPQAGAGESKQIPYHHVYSSPKHWLCITYRGAGERPPRQFAALPLFALPSRSTNTTNFPSLLPGLYPAPQLLLPRGAEASQ